MLVFDLVLATRRPAMTGVERYGLRLFRAVQKVAPDSVAFVANPDFLPGARGLIPLSGVYRGWLELPQEIRRHGLDPFAVVFPTAPASPLFRLTQMRLARIVHDVFPWTRAWAMPWKGRLLYRDVENLMLSRYDLFCGTTPQVAGELRARLDRPEIDWCGNAPGVDFETVEERQPCSLPSEFALAVGTVEPRKDYDRLIALVESGDPDALPIVLVGRPGWGDIVARIESLAARRPDRFHWLRDLTEDAGLLWLYRRAACFVSLSQAEGFNMPLVEAGICARPTLCSDIPIHRAVAPPWAQFAGSDAAPATLWALVAAARRRQPRAQELEDYRRRYGWDAVAARLLDLLSSLK
jgi:glycosyltransferase involved in cell wall biosynthesis